jgi:hypothetical protein
MPKTRRPRLSWFRFYADDFLGGTGALTAPECGRYLLLLLHQWGTKERQVIPQDAERLRIICRGEDPGSLVLSKFDPVEGGFRNQRLADEWCSARQEYNHKAEGGGTKIPARIPGQIPPQIAGRIGPPTKNQEPRTIERTDERRAPGPANPLIQRVPLERECLALVREVSELTGDDPVDVIAQASGYKGAATTKINPMTMSDDRLANTVRDLRADIADLRKKKGATSDAAK